MGTLAKFFVWLIATVVASLLGLVVAIPLKHLTGNTLPWGSIGIAIAPLLFLLGIVTVLLGLYVTNRYFDRNRVGNVMLLCCLLTFFIWGFGMDCFHLSGQFQSAALLAFFGPFIYFGGLIVGTLSPILFLKDPPRSHRQG